MILAHRHRQGLVTSQTAAALYFQRITLANVINVHGGFGFDALWNETVLREKSATMRFAQEDAMEIAALRAADLIVYPSQFIRNYTCRIQGVCDAPSELVVANIPDFISIKVGVVGVAVRIMHSQSLVVF